MLSKKTGSAGAMRTLAKSIARSQISVTKLHTQKAQINSVSMQLATQASLVKVSGIMGKSAEIMKMMNQLVRISALRDQMMLMSKEMMKVCLQISLLFNELIRLCRIAGRNVGGNDK